MSLLEPTLVIPLSSKINPESFVLFKIGSA